MASHDPASGGLDTLVDSAEGAGLWLPPSFRQVIGYSVDGILWRSAFFSTLQPLYFILDLVWGSTVDLL